MFSSIFVGQSKFISHGQNSAALSLRRARFPRGRTTALNNTLLLSVCVVSGNPWWEVSAVFLWPQEREEELLLLPAERAGMWELSAFFSLCFYGPRTGSFLRWGLIHVVWNRKHTHTLSFVFTAFPPSFHRVSIIALITTNKREQPAEAISPVYTSICTIGWSNSPS